ncbi:PREDICTED: F-box/LRR-repeat protein 4-like [Fragaria vesca subsp. vesca]|uniref:F-box/LRR-repeat protein 4-like n=1 Tax=Fragaria vesca subsp. vesca TaxID=101020 RepID=UPI0002C2F081|nr:PREDICTED: F-box/LRR-repeat protein 4-like [Fragaria vesca subsp. vesca]
MSAQTEETGPISLLSEDLLSLILNNVTDQEHRNWCSEVCKQWLKLEGLSRSSLSARKPEFPLAILNRFPNLVQFQTTQLTTDSDLELLARKCPKLEEVKVVDFTSCQQGFLGRKGMSALGYGCPKLSKVSLIGDKIGNAAVVELVNVARSLSSLVLGHNLIGDIALRAIAWSSVTILELKSCCNVTDDGLGCLASGFTLKRLKTLVVKRCKVTDDGVKSLKKMRSLEKLSLCWCTGEITDVGGMAISAIRNLKELKLKGIYGVSDLTVSALAFCKKLEVLDLSGCEGVTGPGIRAFSSHQGLRRLVLLGLRSFGLSDVETLVLGCPSLDVDSVVVEERWRKDPTWRDELMHWKTRLVLKFSKYKHH